MYIVTALIFLVIAGFMASVMRMQLAFPNNHVVGPETFNRLFTMHGTTMVFLVGMPIVAGFSNYLVPLMIGARDMAFPRLNAFGYWIFLFRRAASLLQLHRRRRAVGARVGAGCGMVRLCAADLESIFARREHGFLDLGHSGGRHRQHRERAST